MNVEPIDVKIMELQNRWASCTIKGNLNFHWKCAMAPIDVLNYIVVHELAHLIHPNHSSEFWNTVDKVLSNYDSQVKWLRLNGAGMDL
jgi:predicted metal-dependent hydrolase